MSSSTQVTLNSGPISASVTVSADALIHRIGCSESANASDNVHQMIAEALRLPTGWPALSECVVPGDRVAIVVDPETPALSEIIDQVMQQLQVPGDEGISPTLLLPEDPEGQDWQKLRSELPTAYGPLVAVHVHDPRDENQRGYLATSAGGERVYMSRVLLDADLIVTVGMIGFDSLLGYRGTSSVMYPAFSDATTIQEASGQGHPELTPDERRPMRDLVDEVGWLLGTQFSVQVLPGVNGEPVHVIAGAPDQVQAAGQSQLERLWRISIEETYDLVIVSVPGGRAGGWKKLGNALEVACRLVEQGGRIVVVANVETPEGPAAGMLRRTQEPEDLLKPLRREPTSDATEITQLIQAQRRARIYLLSPVPAEIVEELGMYSLSSEKEIQRLIDQSRSTAVLPGANFAWCDVAASV